MEKNVPVTFIWILYNWYNNLCCSFRWNNVVGESFLVKCGVRQGGVLSHIYTVSQKKGATITMAITLSILGGFAKFFHCWKDQ